MKVDCGLNSNLAKVADDAQKLENLGFDGVLTAETAHDPFLPLLQAANTTKKIDLITAIAVAFARTPMLLANAGHDLNSYSQGRFILGIGSQIQAHITKRFSMPWSNPAARMREYIQAMHAIWANWYKNEPLDFQGEFYTHKLMTPFFTPTDTEYGPPKVFLAAVGPKMTEVAGEVADGIICHAFTNEVYMRNVTLPAISRGLEKSGRTRADFQISYSAFMATGETEEEYEKNRKFIKQQIAFYGSTPAYKGVLAAIDKADMQPILNKMSKQGKWQEMGQLIDDEMLSIFAITGATKNIAENFKTRYGDIADRTSVAYLTVNSDTMQTMLTELQSA